MEKLVSKPENNVEDEELGKGAEAQRAGYAQRGQSP